MWNSSFKCERSIGLELIGIGVHFDGVIIFTYGDECGYLKVSSLCNELRTRDFLTGGDRGSHGEYFGSNLVEIGPSIGKISWKW
jgi:hypothetical protein